MNIDGVDIFGNETNNECIDNMSYEFEEWLDSLPKRQDMEDQE